MASIVELDKKLVRIEKLVKSFRGELEPDEEFAALETDEKLRQSTTRRSSTTF